jgi:hypothetical protein
MGDEAEDEAGDEDSDKDEGKDGGKDRDGDSARPHAFVPTAELQDLLRKEAEPVLKKIITDVSEGESDVPSLPQLIDFVLDNAYKIFGMLLIQSRPDRIITFYNDKFGDGMLPVRRKKVPLRNGGVLWTIASCKQADGSRVELRDSWLAAEAGHFSKEQWPFLARAFERDTFRYEFGEQEVLPLMKRSKDLDNSKPRPYSSVEESSVHKAYITFLDLDVCILFLLPSRIGGHKYKKKH